MQKCFCWAAALSIVLTPLMTQVAFSEPRSAGSQYPEVQNFNVVPPLCYMETADGRVLDLQKVCNDSAKKSTNSGVYGSQFRRDCSSIKCGTSSQLMTPYQLFQSNR